MRLRSTSRMVQSSDFAGFTEHRKGPANSRQTWQLEEVGTPYYNGTLSHKVHERALHVETLMLFVTVGSSKSQEAYL